MNRYEYNSELASILYVLVERNPELRFSQILFAFEFVTKEDEFYLESKDLLRRVRTCVQRMNNEKESSDKD